MSVRVSVLVCTEDSGITRKAWDKLVPGILRHVAPSGTDVDAEVRVLDCSVRWVMAGNQWRTRSATPAGMRIQGAVRELLRHLARVIAEDPPVLVLFHTDSDQVWSQRAQSCNRNDFVSMIRGNLLRVVPGGRPVVDQNVFRMVPCVALESWLFLNQARIDELHVSGSIGTPALSNLVNLRGGLGHFDEVPDLKHSATGIADRVNSELAVGFPFDRATLASPSLDSSLQRWRGSLALKRRLRAPR